MAYNLRETIPNPAGGEYREMSDAELDANIQAASDIIMAAYKRVLPLVIEGNGGDTRAVCKSLAIMGASAVHNFMYDNRQEGGDHKSSDLYPSMESLFRLQIKLMAEVAILRAIGVSDDAIASGKVQIFRV